MTNWARREWRAVRTRDDGYVGYCSWGRRAEAIERAVSALKIGRCANRIEQRWILGQGLSGPIALVMGPWRDEEALDEARGAAGVPV